MKEFNAANSTPIDSLGKLSEEEKDFIARWEIETIEELIDMSNVLPNSLIELLEERGVSFE